jgi:hypothetical protein
VVHLPTDAERAAALRAAADYLVQTGVALTPLPAVIKPAAATVAPTIVENLALEVAKILSNQGNPTVPKPRKKRKDPKMTKALKQSNARFRKKNGSLRAGATQAKIMSYAHKLRRKM